MRTKRFDFEKACGRIGLVAVVCLAVVILADRLSISFLSHRKSIVEKEFAIRDIRQPYPYIMFKGAPHAKAWKHYSVQKGVTDNILNELGYPGAVPTVPKPPGEYRVIVLGGSSVFRGNPAIPRLVQYQFEQQGCDQVKVYNLGVVSSVSSMELARLVFEAVDFDPDLVISYSGFNDIDEPFDADPRPGYPFNYFIYESNPILDSDVRDYPLIPLMAYGSNLMRVFFPSYFLSEFADLETLRLEAGYGTPEWREAIAGNYIRTLVKSQKIAEAFGAEFMAFFQPSLYFKDHISQEEQKFISPQRKNNSLSMRALVLREAARAQRQEGLVLIDLTDYFDGHSETVFQDRVHLRYLFRPVMAKEIFRYVQTHIRQINPPQLTNSACR